MGSGGLYFYHTVPSLPPVAVCLNPFLGPQSRFGDKLLVIRVNCPRIWECGAKGVKGCSEKIIRRPSGPLSAHA